MFVSKGAEAINAERARQVEVEGYQPTTDNSDDLMRAATAYALWVIGRTELAVEIWPWSRWAFKTGEQRKLAIKAGALIAAALDVP